MVFQLIGKILKKVGETLAGQPLCISVSISHIWRVGGKSTNVSAEKHKFEKTAMMQEFMVVLCQKTANILLGNPMLLKIEGNVTHPLLHKTFSS